MKETTTTPNTTSEEETIKLFQVFKYAVPITGRSLPEKTPSHLREEHESFLEWFYSTPDKKREVRADIRKCYWGDTDHALRCVANYRHSHEIGGKDLQSAMHSCQRGTYLVAKDFMIYETSEVASGDMIVDEEGRVYLVKPFGFEEITDKIARGSRVYRKVTSELYPPELLRDLYH